MKRCALNAAVFAEAVVRPSCTNSALSLGMMMASGRTSAMAWEARILAATTCFSAVTKPWSVRSCSFQSPSLALMRAVTYISLTGV